jgi:formate hydrogenlyase subunit 3/multisubunit Na+/H+ antiporter MnhD subunit
MAPLGKAIVVIGLIVAACGFIVWAAPSIPILGRVGRLPGDIMVRRGNFTFYFPLMTSIVISVVVSLLITWMRR